MEKYYSAPGVELFLGDAIETMRSLPEASVDMIFADPPYHLSNGGITVQSGKMVSVDKADWDKSRGHESDSRFHHDWIAESQRLLKPNGTIWVSGTYHSIYRCGFVLQELGFRILNEIVWYKPNAAPNLACRSFAASHETLIWASPGRKAKHVFNYKEMKFSAWEDDFFKRQDKQMRSVWAINTAGVREKTLGKHPTQKPLALLERIVLASTHEGATVLDPFTGSSTTGIAALRHRRDFIGIDNTEEYLELSKRRFEEVM